MNQYKQNVKIWAKDDKMKLADTTGEEGPVDPFKTEHYPLPKHKFNLANKVNLENHWKYDDKIGDPEIKRKWVPGQRWSQAEKGLRCEGADRDYRTIEKVYVHAQAAEIADVEREKLQEEVIIR